MSVIKRKVGGQIGSKLIKAAFKTRGALPGGGRRRQIKQAHSRLKTRQEAAKKSPTNVRRRDRDEVGDSSVDPESGASKTITEKVGIKGEKVSTGAGTRAMPFVKEQRTKQSIARAKKKVAAEARVRDGNPRKGDKEFLARYETEEIARSTRAGTAAAKTRRKWTQKEEDAWQSKAEDAYVNRGEILEHPKTGKDYEPSLAVEKRAERNITAQRKKPRQRQAEALVEKRKFGGKIGRKLTGKVGRRRRPHQAGSRELSPRESARRKEFSEWERKRPAAIKAAKENLGKRKVREALKDAKKATRGVQPDKVKALRQKLKPKGLGKAIKGWGSTGKH